MNRRRIAIDCDDVIVPTAALIIDHYNKAYGSEMTLADLYSHDLGVWNAPDEATAIKRVDDYLKTKEYQQVEPFRDAIEAVHMLAQYHDLHVVTGRGDFLAKATEDMLTEYFPGIFRSIEYTNFYGNSGRDKAQVCRDLGADLLIDDHMHHAEVVAKCGIDVFLFGSYPWNAGDILFPNIKRAEGWNEILHLLV